MNNAREVRTTDIIINKSFDPCPSLYSPSLLRRRRRAAGGGPVYGPVPDLWPYSEITAGVLVLNNGNQGPLSDTITFNTPEGGLYLALTTH